MPPSAGGPEPEVKDATSPASKPQGTLRDHGKGIPPLPEPNVEGVGKESGPSAGTGIGKLSSDQNKMAKDGKMRAEV